MKALLPVFCRPVGYLVLLIALFILPVLYIQGMVTDHNLLFYKECTKLLMMSGIHITYPIPFSGNQFYGLFQQNLAVNILEVS